MFNHCLNFPESNTFCGPPLLCNPLKGTVNLILYNPLTGTVNLTLYDPLKGTVNLILYNPLKGECQPNSK